MTGSALQAMDVIFMERKQFQRRGPERRYMSGYRFIEPWRMTGSALRLEESRDGRCIRARRGKHLSSGGVQGGSGGGIHPRNSPGGFEISPP